MSGTGIRLGIRPGIRFEAAGFASTPAEFRGLPRDQIRLLVADPDSVSHHRFCDLGQHLRSGDVLVVNDSATVASELDATWQGEPIVLHLGQRLSATEVVCELRTAPDAAHAVLTARAGQRVSAGSANWTLLEAWPGISSPTGLGNRLWRSRVAGDAERLLAEQGRPIAYGYLAQRFEMPAYQTVFGRRPGSAEMASAGRGFTTEMVQRLLSAGVQIAPVTLHTGLSSTEAGELPGPEWFQVSSRTARTVSQAKASGGRVVAVGTTSTRAIESSVRAGQVVASSGWTSRVITPADPPQVVDGLITGWHDPHASHLLLVEAVVGAAVGQRAYDAAVRAGYLWHEFGDAALLFG